MDRKQFIFEEDVEFLEGENFSLPIKSKVKEEFDNRASSKWSWDDTMYIISRYIDLEEKFKSGKFPHKHLWNEIGAAINMSGSQCATKFRNLKRQYMYIIRDNKKKNSGGALTWAYFNVMDNIFAKKPEAISKKFVESAASITFAEETIPSRRSRRCSNSSISSESTSIGTRKRTKTKHELQGIISLLQEDLKERKTARHEKKVYRQKLKMYREQNLLMKKDYLILLRDLVSKNK